MILDNKNENRKVHEWIRDYTDSGKMDLVSGYFTIGALAYLAREINGKIQAFRFVLGDIVSNNTLQERTIDLLNENISIEAALRLSSLAREAVDFLKQNKVEVKTLEPNFCHAKVYLFDPEKDERCKYFISGSSNLTEAGIGLKPTSNVELNIAETGNNDQYKELAKWFDDLWNKEQAHKEKPVIQADGKKSVQSFKAYLIEEIERIFIQYTPKQIYYKVLFELFGHQLLIEQGNGEFNRQVGRLENTAIYNALYEFQQKGVLSLIKMLKKYDGAVLADAVGLGKTWSALAVMKFFQLQGREIILICPKKLQRNWQRYTKHQDSKFEKDQLEYFIRFHTDLYDERLERYDDRADKLFTNDRPKLFVIDESHNLRNSKSQRYKFLVDEILNKNEDAKVLMLSATPINNTLIDIRNQFKLIVKGSLYGFDESHGIKNIDYTFRNAQAVFNKWREDENPKISDFIKELPANFFKLTDSLIVARTRLMIEKQKSGLHFPEKARPENIFITPKKIGNFDSFEELFECFPPMLSAYQPTFYIEQKKDVNKFHDEQQRDRFLVKMLYILLVKRLESSWFSFHSTIQRVLERHQDALDKINNYQKNKKKAVFEDPLEQDLSEDSELKDIVEDFTLGQKRRISLTEIDKADNLERYKSDLKADIQALDSLDSNLNRFSVELKAELKKPRNYESKDDKLRSLISMIIKKRSSGANNYNQKVLIFTVYKDTAFYLFEQLRARGFDKIAVVSGDAARTDTSKTETKKFETILERFAPYTKLFREKEWNFSSKGSNHKLSNQKEYAEWCTWLAGNDEETYKKIQEPIDILIATDVLSEGQNLQDCDMAINYDIHWNPVRVIQRMGRIDRLGSPNKTIFGINYWPSNSIEAYLNLKGRVEERMAMMKLAGAETPFKFSDRFEEMASDADFEDRLNKKMLKQMQTSWEDIEEHESGLGFENLSLEDFRQDLLEELQKNQSFYKNMPKGVYTGFKADKSICSSAGIIALLAYPTKPPGVLEHEYQYDLAYMDMNGKQILWNQKEILDALAQHKNKNRVVPNAVEKGKEAAIEELVAAIKNWLNSQAVEEEQEDGIIKQQAGTATMDLLAKLKAGDREASQRIKQNIKMSDKYKAHNFDLIAWFLVT